VPRDGKLKSESLRASALLSLDDGSWRVRATEWSAAVPNHPYEGCGNIESVWQFTSGVSRELAAPVKAVIDAFRAMPAADGMRGGDRGPLLKLLSDDPSALVVGSAASERFAGGAAIKAVFKKWFITFGYWEGEDKSIPARAGLGADGELMWMYIATMSHAQCTQYRTLLVLAKETAGWRLVHQHYSEPIAAP
jgi:ketosteroid isomerase-like protein